MDATPWARRPASTRARSFIGREPADGATPWAMRPSWMHACHSHCRSQRTMAGHPQRRQRQVRSKQPPVAPAPPTTPVYATPADALVPTIAPCIATMPQVPAGNVTSRSPCCCQRSRRRASSSNRLPQPCIRIPVPSRRRAPILRRASATIHSHPWDHSPHWPRPFVVPARPCTRMTRSSVASAPLCVGPEPFSVRLPRPLPALTPTFAPVRPDHAPYPPDGALEKPHCPPRRRDHAPA